MVDAERPPLSVAELSARLAAKEQEVEDVKQSSHAALEDVQRQVVEAFTRLDELRGLLKEREVTLQESHAPSWDDDGGFSNQGDDNPAAGTHGTPDDVISSHSDASPDRSPLKTGSRAIEGAGLSTKSSASLQVQQLQRELEQREAWLEEGRRGREAAEEEARVAEAVAEKALMDREKAHRAHRELAAEADRLREQVRSQEELIRRLRDAAGSGSSSGAFGGRATHSVSTADRYSLLAERGRSGSSGDVPYSRFEEGSETEGARSSKPSCCAMQ